MTILSLIGAGCRNGALHIATGPDHLSAILTVTTLKGVRALKDGLIWGVGHSIGILLVTLLVVNIEPIKDSLSEHGTANTVINYIAAVMMILFGLYYLIKMDIPVIEQKVSAVHHTRSVLDITPRVSQKDVDDIVSQIVKGSVTPRESMVVVARRSIVNSSTTVPSIVKNPENEMSLIRVKEGEYVLSDPLMANEQKDGFKEELIAEGTDVLANEEPKKEHKPWVVRLAAPVCGILHGAAGPGGMLGILPTAKLSGWDQFTFLTAFLVSSTLIMGLMSLAWGVLTFYIGINATKRITKWTYIFASIAPIVIGIIWLILTIQGKDFDDVFGADDGEEDE